MGPTVLCTCAKIRKILRAALEKSPKREQLFWTLNPYNPGLRIFQKDHLAQTMGPIVLYTHIKNWEDPKSRFGERAKNTTRTDGKNDGRTGFNL